ncbi:MAG: TIGR04255 family protein [Plectolyngbya sp. WJT66-NPBG17]|nr:TIGR04255 family protein [Plectolyngbya sp. WJT66-NPBG17]
MTLVGSSKLPSFENPPVTEVACSVLFRSIEELATAHVGLLWQAFQPEYPYVEDTVPLASKVEFFENKPIEAKLQITGVPPMPRVWFITESGNRVIQIQRERFIHNWRKIQNTDEYPRYESVVNKFQEYLSTFEGFLANSRLSKLSYLQYELTYVNQIPQSHGWKTFEDIGNIFPDFSWRTQSERFLKSPKSLNWGTSFDLPDEIGRLYVGVSSAMQGNEPILLVELTVRGIGDYAAPESLRKWFDIAHDWIVRAFADLTAESIQTEIWKRKG